MTRSNSKKQSNFKPRVGNQQHSDYFEFNSLSDSLSKLFTPLLHYLYSPSSGSSSKMIRSNRNCLNTADLKYNGSGICRNKSKYKQRKEIPNIILVDLRKIEDNLSLSSKEKSKLKRVLKSIKVDNEGEIDQEDISKNMCNSNYNVNNGRVYSTVNYDKNLENYKVKRGDMINNKDVPVDSKFTKFKHEKLLRGHKCKKVLTSRNNTDFPDPSDSSSVYIESDCNINNSRSLSKTKSSSSGTRTILKVKPCMNIANVRLKYVNPICLVQYGINGNGEEDYSRATLRAHLGEGRCPQVNVPHPGRGESRNSPEYDADEEDYVIAKGTLTEELVESFKALKEIRNTLFPDGIQCSSKDEDPDSECYTRGTKLSLKKLTRKRTELRTIQENDVAVKPPSPEEGRGGRMHWDVESFPSTLINLEKDDAIYREPTKSMNKGLLQRHKSAINKLKGFFIRTCFCFCFEDDSKISYDYSFTVPNKGKRFGNMYKKAPSNLKSKVKIIRTTESDFLYNKPKTK